MIVYTDHKGKTYPTFKAMCEEYDKTADCVKKRMKNGMTLEEALTSLKWLRKGQYYTDPKGVEYASLSAMCKAWGQTRSMVSQRLQKGMDLEQALTMAPNSDGIWNRKECTDHFGNHFSSVREKCRFYHVPPRTYQSRIAAGYSEEEALTPRLSKQSASDLLKTYGNIIKIHQYYNRICKGWSPKNAASIPPVNSVFAFTDFLGQFSGKCINPKNVDSTLYFDCVCEECAKSVGYDKNQPEAYRFVGTIDQIREHYEYHQNLLKEQKNEEQEEEIER